MYENYLVEKKMRKKLFYFMSPPPPPTPKYGGKQRDTFQEFGGNRTFQKRIFWGNAKDIS